MSRYQEAAIQAFGARKFDAAARAFQQVLDEDPDDIGARAGLGQSLCQVGRSHEGLRHLVQAGEDLLDLAQDDGQIGDALDIAQLLQQFGDHLAAHGLLTAALELAPHEPRCLQMLAVSAAQLNRKSEALAAAQEALAAQPNNQMLQVLLGSIEADAGVHAAAGDRLRTVLAAAPGPREAFRAHKELARVCDRLGQFDEALAHLEASAAVGPQLPEYRQQPQAMLPNMVKSHRIGFDLELLQRWKGRRFSAAHPAPVFLMGFFRSGTTLTQEVLDAHPKLHVADEADFIASVNRELHRIDPSPASTPAKLRKLDDAGVERLRAHYWQRVRDRLGPDVSTEGFVDKFTLNTVDLGLISCVFPDAKVIFVMRDPRDVCLSCFMQLMAPSPATVHLLSLASTARLYAQVMDWWLYVRELMAPSFIEFRYEDAVTDFEPTFRRVLDFLGVGWDAEVTRFHERAAQKSIASPSRGQVAQPLYASSVARWHHYAIAFAAVEGELAPFVRHFRYGPPAPAPAV